MKELITVIVPVYNVEEYLRDCVQSIICQTYCKLQIILVDDGSTDDSGVVCDLLAQEDQRIIVLHKKNGGQGSARNLALDVAQGEFLFFVDSDDMIAPNTIEKMYGYIQQYNADICACNYLKFQTVPKILSDTNRNLIFFDRESALYDICKDEILKSYVWNKLFRSEMFSEKRFPCNKVFEDAAVLIEVVSNAKKIVYTYERYYFYRERPSSTVHQVTEKKYLNELEAYENQVEFAKKECPRGICWIECKIAEIIRDLLDYGYIDTHSAMSKRMKSIYRKYLLFILQNKRYSKGMKLAALINSVSVGLYKIIRRR